MHQLLGCYGHVPYDYEHCILALEERTQHREEYKTTKSRVLVNNHVEKQSSKSFQLRNQRHNYLQF